MHISEVYISPITPDRFKVVKSFTISKKDFEIVIPTGFVTDGASIPRIFWSIFPPNKPEYIVGAIAHDYVTDVLCGIISDEIVSKHIKTFYQADDFLKEILIHNKASKFAQLLIPFSCKVYHFFRYHFKGR